ncbi:MAG: hypothetical protein MIO90_06025, partial [Methanomassiliicoccales archaeon]|nr:hypothetical protein [Methanomassiliicoccales archaeon]
TMISEMGLSTEEVSYILDKKVDSADVKHLMQDVEKLRLAREASLRPVRQEVKEQLEEEKPPEKRPETKGKQRSLFEYSG